MCLTSMSSPTMHPISIKANMPFRSVNPGQVAALRWPRVTEALEVHGVKVSVKCFGCGLP